MKFYLAPMEGITGYIQRRAYHKHFGNVDRYFTPFIPAAKRMSKKIIRDISPENNPGMDVVPQIMSNKADEVIDLGNQLKAYGYDSLNINLGCPSGTVVSKKRGSGFLTMPEELDQFLYDVYDQTDMKVSIKTRIGFENEEEWGPLVDIYKKYPIDELIIHPRVRKDFYHGVPRLESFDLAVKEIPVSLCYNGDITSVSSYEEIATRYPTINKVMIGRGLLAHPNLIGDIKGESPMTKDTLRAYHDTLLADYEEMLCGERDPLFRMKEVWSYMRDSFEESDKYWKKIKKCMHMDEYHLIIDSMFRDLELKI